jgi:hypothetical protein
MNPEEDTNFYNPDDDGSEKSADKPKSTGTITWSASEYIDHQRGASWYGLLSAATIGLAVIVYFLTKDYFATGTIVVLGIIVGVFVGRKPAQVEFELSESGLHVAQKAYNYNRFKSFTVLKEGNLVSLSLMPIKRFMPPVSAYFDPKDEQKITNLIGEHLPFQESKPSTVDRLSIRLKL